MMLFSFKKDPEWNFIELYSKRELAIVGLKKETALYKKILKCIKFIYDQRFGMPAEVIALGCINSLLQLKPVSSCTHNEYKCDMSRASGLPEGSLFQCGRCLNMVSKDGGKTWEDTHPPAHDCHDKKCKCKNKKVSKNAAAKSSKS
jgi:hypothetical protein